MPLKDLLKKKEKLGNEPEKTSLTPKAEALPEFTFIRTDTNTEEIIQPPSFVEDSTPPPQGKGHTTPPPSPKRGLGRFRSISKASVPNSPEVSKEKKGLTERLHIGKSRASSTSSVNIPADLPPIDDTYKAKTDKQEKEAQWEERATRLVSGSRPPTADMARMTVAGSDNTLSRSTSRARSLSDAQSDETLQEAIRLHEAGELTQATQMFGRLAESGNVLSQVLYGLSLRHGWGCEVDAGKAVTYLSAAAANSASIEAEALKAGNKKGGAAKGELILAIFELANSFRYGWGVAIDKPAARQYYETAANLGDTDAMNEAAWCYLEGFGGKKDKVCASFPESFSPFLPGISLDVFHAFRQPRNDSRESVPMSSVLHTPKAMLFRGPQTGCDAPPSTQSIHSSESHIPSRVASGESMTASSSRGASIRQYRLVQSIHRPPKLL